MCISYLPSECCSQCTVWNKKFEFFLPNYDCLPAYPTCLCQSVSQVLDKWIDRHVHPKHTALPTSAPVDNSHVDWSAFPLGEGEGDADVGVKGARAGVARWTDDGWTKLSLEEILYEGVVSLHVAHERLCCDVLIGSTCTVLLEWEM